MSVPRVISQHIEDAAFQWTLRQRAVGAPHYHLDSLVDLDDQVEANIDGLRIAEGDGWVIRGDGLNVVDAGECFVVSVIALEGRLTEQLDQILLVAEVEETTLQGLISALGWVAKSSLRGTVRDLLSSQVSFRRSVGIAACVAHRVDPGKSLQRAILDGDEAEQCRSLRALGELGRIDERALLQARCRADAEACRFWAAWSSVLTGDRGEALELLSFMATAESPFRERAIQVVLRAMEPAAARQWLKGLRDSGESLRHVIMGAGIAGDPAYVPWLIGQMKSPEMARVAGEAFSMITGIDLTYENLDWKEPDGVELGPTDDPEDEDVEMDPDKDLPWPNRELIDKWWSVNKGRFTLEERHLVGEPVTEVHCQQVLRDGYQRQRRGAALELALMAPGTPLFETRAPGVRQQHWLDAGGWLAQEGQDD